MIKINKLTNEASREALPAFLQGLKPESLYDLSWTDSNLGVQNFAWFNEQDVTVYDSNLVLDGTESFEIDFKNHLVKVTKGQRAKTTEEIAIELEAKQKELERTIEAHIDSVVKAKGYNNQDSIAKYLVDTNPFYEECKSISIWIGNVWIKAHEIQSEVQAGTRPIPTINEVIAELPVLV